ERHGAGRPCLLSDGDTWSYGDLRRHADQVARVLTEDFGVVPGNRVLLRGPNTPWLAACWLGAVKSGAVVVTTMALLRSAELTAICEIAQVRLALCDSRLTGELAAAGVPGIQLVGYGGDGPDDLVQRAAAKPAGFTAVATAADDVAMIAFTSGTTGRPKAAMHFHREVLAIADTFSARVLRPTPDDIFTGTPPFAFPFGLGGLLIFPLLARAASLLLERGAPRRSRPPHRRPWFHGLLHGADRLPGDARRRQGRPAARPAPSGLGGRAPVGGHLAGVLRRHRRADH